MIWDDSPRKRTLGIRDKQILWRRDGKKCGNPTCGKSVDFDEMQVGHKKAHSKGGSATLSNTITLCYRCNKLQGTDSWAVFLKKQGVVDKKKVAAQTVKTKLQALTVTQLKSLATKHGIKVSGRLVDDWGDSTRAAPTKAQYVTKLSKALSASQIRATPTRSTKTTAPKRSPAKKKTFTRKTTAKTTSAKRKTAARKRRKKADDEWSLW